MQYMATRSFSLQGIVLGRETFHRRVLSALAAAVRRVLAAKIPPEGAADRGVNESIYLRDPDGNGVELYCDKPKEMCPHTPEGELAMFTRRLDLHELLNEAPRGTEVDGGPRDLSFTRYARPFISNANF